MTGGAETPPTSDESEVPLPGVAYAQTATAFGSASAAAFIVKAAETAETLHALAVDPATPAADRSVYEDGADAIVHALSRIEAGQQVLIEQGRVFRADRVADDQREKARFTVEWVTFALLVMTLIGGVVGWVVGWVLNSIVD